MLQKSHVDHPSSAVRVVISAEEVMPYDTMNNEKHGSRIGAVSCVRRPHTAILVTIGNRVWLLWQQEQGCHSTAVLTDSGSFISMKSTTITRKRTSVPAILHILRSAVVCDIPQPREPIPCRRFVITFRERSADLINIAAEA
jgi:hypothetical protein